MARIKALIYPDWYGVEIVWSQAAQNSLLEVGSGYVPMEPEWGDPVKDLIWESITVHHIKEYENHVEMEQRASA